MTVKQFLLSISFLLVFGICQGQNVNFFLANSKGKIIKKEILVEAKSLVDINEGFPASWIEKYISVEVAITKDGKTTRSIGQDQILTEEQKQLLETVEIGTDILFEIHYYPFNSIDGKAAREIAFSYSMIPSIEAIYQGGLDVLDLYINENIINKISAKEQKDFAQAEVSFVIDEKGLADEIKVSQSSGNLRIDLLIRETIQNMEAWTPAKEEGQLVKQNFTLNIGNMIGC